MFINACYYESVAESVADTVEEKGINKNDK